MTRDADKIRQLTNKPRLNGLGSLHVILRGGLGLKFSGNLGICFRVFRALRDDEAENRILRSQ